MIIPRERLPALLVTLIVSAPLGWMAGGHGVLKKAGASIVALELARTPARAREVLDIWARAGVSAVARHSLYWDFGFIASYVLFGTLLAAGLAVEATPAGQILAGVASIGVVVAGLCDVGENLALLAVLRGAVGRIGIATMFA